MKAKKIVLVSTLLMGSFCLNSAAQRESGHFSLDLTGKSVSISDIQDSLYNWLDIDGNTSFKVIRDEVDDINIRHLSLQQYYGELPVDGNIVLIHSKEGIVRSINGVVMGKNNSIEKDATSTSFRSSKSNDQIKIVPINENGTVIYKKVIEVSDNNKRIFLDTETKDTVKVLSKIYNIDGKAYTMYQGWQDISCSEDNGKYILRDDDRNIYTCYGGNTTTGLIEATQYRDACDSYRSPSTTFSGVITSVKITNVSGNWWGNSLIDSKPDLYIKIKDSKGNLLHKSSVQEDLNPPVSWNFENLMLHIDEKSTIEIYDEDLDSDDDGGSVTLNTVVPGTYSWSGAKTSGIITIKANPALDAHWGMQKVLDFYSSILNRNGYNNKGTIIYQFIDPVGHCGKDLNNAFAAYDNNGIGYMMYGMGNGSLMYPVVALDVMAHEFTHMVTDFNGNGGLNYAGESGALNESFSDILGTTTEAFALGEKFNWSIGEDVMVMSTELRKMNDPKNSMLPSKEKLTKAYLNLYGVDDISLLPENVQNSINSMDCTIPEGSMPDTYKGEFWVETEDLDNDNGGVHTNSGVQNYWFYLLTTGGKGTNDNNENYSVEGIGMLDAVKIAYRNLTFYLTPDATYEDAVDGSMKAAEDLFGASSKQQKSVYDAWYAVGLHTEKYDKIYGNSAVSNISNDDMKIFTNMGNIYIESNFSSIVTVTSVEGKMLHKIELPSNQEVCLNVSKENIVIVKIGDVTKKIIVTK